MAAAAARSWRRRTCAMRAAGRVRWHARRLGAPDLLDLRAQRLEVVGRRVATERFLDLGRACFQNLAGVFEVSVRRDGRALLDGLDRLGKASCLRFQALQAGIQPLLVGLVAEGLVAQGRQDAEEDQPEPHQALHHHGGGRSLGRLRAFMAGLPKPWVPAGTSAPPRWRVARMGTRRPRDRRAARSRFAVRGHPRAVPRPGQPA